ncbi:MAG: triose-phosphate isomerase [Rickettsiaceae bacterium]|nr:triose-phosphate isomerase [Rickettsiaceae bacterium]
MNLLLEQALLLAKQVSSIENANHIIIAPTSPYLAYLINQLPQMHYAAQNISIYDTQGAYTGEYSAEIIKSCGVNYTIIGHNERRKLLSETDSDIKKKINNAIKHNITPIICIGENIESKHKDQTEEHLTNQLEVIPENYTGEIIIAYEPIWCIGSGLVPKISEISEIAQFIKNHKKLSSVANNLRMVYGGSVNSINAREILKIHGIDGLMIGSVALKFEEIKLILETISNV